MSEKNKPIILFNPQDVKTKVASHDFLIGKPKKEFYFELCAYFKTDISEETDNNYRMFFTGFKIAISELIDLFDSVLASKFLDKETNQKFYHSFVILIRHKRTLELVNMQIKFNWYHLLLNILEQYKLEQESYTIGCELLEAVKDAPLRFFEEQEAEWKAQKAKDKRQDLILNLSLIFILIIIFIVLYFYGYFN